MKKRSLRILFILLTFLFTYCASNVLAARYYRLLEKERKIFLGLRGVDTLAAATYLDLESATERAYFYENFWRDKNTEVREEFEKKIDYAYLQFGRYASFDDNRIPIYVKYGEPSRREVITPQKKIGIKTREAVKPAEVWTYKQPGLIFDFIRIVRAYKVIAVSEFGEKVKIPYLKEIASDTSVATEPAHLLNFNVTTGRFRQKRNLTRLEIYLSLDIEDTTGMIISRHIRIFNKKDSLINEKKDLLIPQDGEKSRFFDEINFWLMPEEYRFEIELADLKNKRVGKKAFSIDLIDYQNDTKEISDIIPAKLIDDAFTNEKFNKPVGRVIPLTQAVLPMHTPFYFYTEAYNLETKNGLHQLRTTYEVYNKSKMRQEIVDVMINDWVEPGDIAYLGTEYHPMDLSPGYYILVAKIKDLISGKERSAVTEFELVPVE